MRPITATVQFTHGTAIPLSAVPNFANIQNFKVSKIWVEPDAANVAVCYVGDASLAILTSAVNHVFKQVAKPTATDAVLDHFDVDTRHGRDLLDLRQYAVDGANAAAGTIRATSLGAAATSGRIVTASLGAGGLGYVAGDTGTIDGGTGGTYVVNTIGVGGAVVTFTITANGRGYPAGVTTTTDAGSQAGVGVGFTISLDTLIGGTGYAAGDTGTIDGGTAGTYLVGTVDASGGVLTYSITGAGTAYSTGVTTTTDAGAQAGAGVGFAISIDGLTGEKMRVTVYVG